MSEKYQVLGIEFSSKNALIDGARSIRDRYDNNVYLNKIDFEFMVDFLKYHKRSEEKIGIGIKRIWIQNNDYRNREFWLERIDGTITDFSFSLRKPSKIDDFKIACRKAIANTIIQYRNAYFKKYAIDGEIICPITGKLIKKISESHVDHQPPMTFEKIVTDFIKEYKVDIQGVELSKGDGINGVLIVDPFLEAKWINYHNSVASLRIISKDANLRLRFGNDRVAGGVK